MSRKPSFTWLDPLEILDSTAERSRYLKSSLSTTPNNWFRTEESRLVYTPSRVSFVEVRQSRSNEDPPKLEKGPLRPDEIEAWLGDSRIRASDSSASLRILFGDCNQLNRINNTSSQFLEIPFSRQKFERVIDSLNVQPQFVWALEEPSAQVSQFRGASPKECSYVFKLPLHATGYYSLSIAYDPTIRLTSVLFLAQTHFSERSMVVAMLYWRNYKALISQPMLVPFLVCTAVSELHSTKIQVSIETLNAIEEELGQHTYTDRYKGDPLKADFVATTTKLNGNTTRLAINEARLKSLISALGRIRQYIDNDVATEDSTRRSSNVLVDHVLHLKDYCENLLLRNDAEQKRTATQLAVVYNFMAQKDNLLNLELAHDSKEIAAAGKRDSAAMKTISIVTMLFLPGTYVAALFAMPLFIWDAAPGNSVLNARFWYYWAVTIPLTVTVLIVWLSFKPLLHFGQRTLARLPIAFQLSMWTYPYSLLTLFSPIRSLMTRQLSLNL